MYFKAYFKGEKAKTKQGGRREDGLGFAKAPNSVFFPVEIQASGDFQETALPSQKIEPDHRASTTLNPTHALLREGRAGQCAQVGRQGCLEPAWQFVSGGSLCPASRLSSRSAGTEADSLCVWTWSDGCFLACSSV